MLLSGWSMGVRALKLKNKLASLAPLFPYQVHLHRLWSPWRRLRHMHQYSGACRGETWSLRAGICAFPFAVAGPVAVTISTKSGHTC